MRYSSHKSVSFGYRKSLQRIYLSVPLNSDSSNITVQPQEGSKPSAYPPFNRSSLSSPADFLFPSFQSLRCLKLCCFWYRALNMSMHVRSWWDLELYWYNGTTERRPLEHVQNVQWWTCHWQCVSRWNGCVHCNSYIVIYTPNVAQFKSENNTKSTQKKKKIESYTSYLKYTKYACIIASCYGWTDDYKRLPRITTNIRIIHYTMKFQFVEKQGLGRTREYQITTVLSKQWS